MDQCERVSGRMSVSPCIIESRLPALATKPSILASISSTRYYSGAAVNAFYLEKGYARRTAKASTNMMASVTTGPILPSTERGGVGLMTSHHSVNAQAPEKSPKKSVSIVNDTSADEKIA